MMAEKPDQTGATGSKGSLKTALAVLILLGLEAVLIVGVGFSVIARTLHPDRTFGVLLFVRLPERRDWAT